jgi:Novel STAND NTPase 1
MSSTGPGKQISLSADVRVQNATGSEVVGVKVGTLVGTLIYVFGAPGAAPAGPPPRRGRDAEPYRSLEPYTIDDRDLFYGREALIGQLCTVIRSHAVTALIGKAAVGKTSLIHAGLVPQLAGDGNIAALSLRDYSAPAAGIRDQLGQIPNLTVTLPEGASLGAVLSSFAAQANKPVVVFFDQFERLFERSVAEQEEFARQIAGATRGAPNQNLENRLHLVFVLRDKFQGYAADLDARIRDANLLSNQQFVPGLSSDQARAAIANPLKVPGEYDRATLEEGLIDNWILPQLAAISDSSDGRIDPAPLQIICSRLFAQAREEAGAGQQPVLSVRLYQGLGQAQGILSGFLSDERAQLGVSDEEWTGIRELLGVMASSDTLDYATTLELARKIGRPESEVQRWLERLAAHRLVEARSSLSYALIGNYMIREIRQWYPEVYDEQMANQALQRTLKDWEDGHILTERRRLKRIYDARALLRPSPQAYALLLRSAVAYEANPQLWLAEIAKDAHAQETLDKLERGDRADPVVREVAGILFEGSSDERYRRLEEAAVRSPIENVRIASALALSPLGIPKVMDAFRPYLEGTPPAAPDDRRRASLALAWIRLLGLGGDWRPFVTPRLVFFILPLLRLRARRVEFATIAASAFAGTVLVGIVLALTHLVVVIAIHFANPVRQFVSSLAVGVVIGGIIGLLYGLGEVTAPPERPRVRAFGRWLSILSGFALANLVLQVASSGVVSGFEPLLVGALVGVGFAAANELALARFPGRIRRRVILSVGGLVASAGVAALLTFLVIKLGQLPLAQGIVWNFAGGINPYIFDRFTENGQSVLAWFAATVASGGIIGLGLAGGLAIGDWLNDQLERARYV